MRGRLLGLPDGLDLDPLYVEAMRGSLTLDATVQEDGRFETLGLPEGDWPLRAHAWVGNDEVCAGVAQVVAGSTVKIPMKSSSDEPAGR